MRTKKIIFLLLVLVFLSFTTGCLGGLFNNKPIITSTPETTAKVGIEYTYEIEATDPDGDTLTYALVEDEYPEDMTINGTTVSWTPTVDQLGPNPVTVEVSDGKVSVFQTFNITVGEALLDSIVVVPSEMRVPIGSSETITSITAHYENGTEADIELDSDDVSYGSDDEDIATVSELGVVTGVSAGTAEITVSYTEGEITVTDTIDVTVPPALITISVKPEFMNIFVGNSQPITSIKAYYEGGTHAFIELNEASYDVDSTDTQDIITVDNLGVVTGELASEDWQTIIVSYTEGGITKTDTVYVKVEEEPVILTSLTVLPVTMEISVAAVDPTDEITRIIAGYSDATSADVPLNSADVDYISSNTGVATVDTTGVITAVAVGTATITVNYTETGITETDTVAVTVTE